MLRELSGAFEPVFREQGGLGDAISCLEAGEPVLIHVQWEEFYFLSARTAEEADTEAALVEAKIRRVIALGGSIVWTVHNALPHRIPHVASFMKVRRLLGEVSSRILVHNDYSRAFICEQLDIAGLHERIHTLPHPSYAGLYEPEDVADAAVRARATPSDSRFLLGFGTIRKQKGFDEMLEVLDPDFTATLGMRLRIAGAGAEGPPLQNRFGHREDIDWDLTYIAMDEVPALFRAASAIVLPYTRLLTSGVALLALTLGGIVVAPALPTFIELLPPPLRRFLYDPKVAGDLRRVVSDLAWLTPAEDLQYRLAGMEAVRSVHPALISKQLGCIYQDLAREMGSLPRHAGLRSVTDERRI